MNTYKNKKVGEAVKALLDYHNMAETLKAEMEAAKKRYSPEVYNKKYQEAQAKFSPYYYSAERAIKEAVNDIIERGEKAMSDSLSIGNAAADFQLLSLPVNLSADELRVMAKRNEGNVLFGRAVSNYAKEHGFTGAGYRDFDSLGALAAYQGSTDMIKKEADEFSRVLSNYLVSDQLSRMTTNWQKHALQRLDAEGVFVEV